MTTPNTTTTVEIHENAFWPDEANLADFAGQDVQAAQADRAEMAHRLEQTEQSSESICEYAALYFVA